MDQGTHQGKPRRFGSVERAVSFAPIVLAPVLLLFPANRAYLVNTRIFQHRMLTELSKRTAVAAVGGLGRLRTGRKHAN
jgi:hypothetical protein